jgi:hypothetical protein
MLLLCATHQCTIPARRLFARRRVRRARPSLSIGRLRMVWICRGRIGRSRQVSQPLCHGLILHAPSQWVLRHMGGRTRWNFVVCALTAANGVSGSGASILASRSDRICSGDEDARESKRVCDVYESRDKWWPCLPRLLDFSNATAQPAAGGLQPPLATAAHYVHQSCERLKVQPR